MEKDRQFQMSTRQIDWSNLYADPEATRPTIIGLVHGASFRPIGDLSVQHGEDRSFTEKQFHHQHQ